MSDNILKELFSVLPEDNAEELWYIAISDYLDTGGDIASINSSNGWGLLHYASENLFESVVKLLLVRGIPVDAKASDGSTPYLVALDAAIDGAIQDDMDEIDFSVVKVLIEKGADVDASSVDGISRERLLYDYGERATEEYHKQFGHAC